MKHLKTFEGYSNIEITNEEEGLFSMFKSDASKGFAVATQGNNFYYYVQQLLDPISGARGSKRRLNRNPEFADVTKEDFMKFAKLIKKLNFDFKSINGAVKADEKMEKIFHYICERGLKSAQHTASGSHQFGSGEGPSSGDKFEINPDFDPEEVVSKVRERAAEEVVDSSKTIAPKSKFESARVKKEFRRVKK